MYFTTAGMSKKGGRAENQDCFDYINVGEFYCWVLADGLGGHLGGKKASETAVSTIIKAFKEKPGVTNNHVKEYINIVQVNINSIKIANEEYRDMKTTIVLALSDGRVLRVCHIGDSRLYYLNTGIIRYRTVDHSIAQTLANIGNISEEEIMNHPSRHKLVYVLGDDNGNSIQNIDVKEFKIEDGDAVFMCTDGVWEYLSDNELEIEYSKTKCPYLWIMCIEKRILSKIYQSNKKNDNYTMIGVYFNNDI